jgi:predicted nucleotidyltransferase
LGVRYHLAMQAGHIEIDDEKLRTFCEKWGIAELAIFGSVLRDDFRPDSDIDFLVTWKAGKRPRSYFEVFPIKDELAGVVGRDVDLIERRSAEQIRNPYRRRNILSTAATIYAAA